MPNTKKFVLFHKRFEIFCTLNGDWRFLHYKFGSRTNFLFFIDMWSTLDIHMFLFSIWMCCITESTDSPWLFAGACCVLNIYSIQRPKQRKNHSFGTASVFMEENKEDCIFARALWHIIFQFVVSRRGDVGGWSDINPVKFFSSSSEFALNDISRETWSVNVVALRDYITWTRVILCLFYIVVKFCSYTIDQNRKSSNSILCIHVYYYG